MKTRIRTHYHWVIAAIALLMVFIHSGAANNISSLFTLPVTKTLGITRAEYSFAFTANAVAAMFSSFLSGVVFNKLGFRKASALGLLAAASGYTLLAFSKSYWMMFPACALLGASLGMCGTAGVTRVVGDWFVRHRGVVMGAVTASSGIGGSVVCILQTLVMESFSWRIALGATATVLVLLAIISFCFTRSSPSDMQLKPLGDGEEVVGKRRRISERAHPGLSFDQLKKRPSFYLMILCIFLSCFPHYSAFNVIVPHLVDCGLSSVEASSVQSIYLLLLTATKFLAGVFSDRFTPYRVQIVCLATTVLSLVLMPFIQGAGFALFVLIIYSVATPVMTVMVPLLGFSLFGYKAQQNYSGIFISAVYVANLAASPLTNTLHEIFGSYRVPFFISAGIAALALVLFVVLRHLTKKDRALETEE